MPSAQRRSPSVRSSSSDVDVGRVDRGDELVVPVAARPRPKRSRTTWSTPSTCAIWSPIAGEKPVPITLLTTKSPTKFSATDLSTLALAESPTIAIVQASARPIIRADAVAGGTARVAQRVLAGEVADAAERRARTPRAPAPGTAG